MSGLSLSVLPVDWQERAEPLTPEAVEGLRPEERETGIHDITCPDSEVPTMLIVTEAGEFLSLRNP